MSDRTGSEIIFLDLTTPAMEARREESRAIRAVRHGMVLKVLLGSLVFFATLVTLLLRR